MLEKIEKTIGRLVDGMGLVLAIVLLLMVVNVSYDVLMRYMFRNSSVGMQEMEWHLFSFVILYGVGVALRHEGHVRVDVVYDRLSVRHKAIINVLGTVLFLVPLSLFIMFGSIDYVRDAYVAKEISEDPGGLPFRWIIKSMIPLSFGFLLISATGYVIQNIQRIGRGK
ncbi:MAG: C4-dicarboxylate ABC transporter permease [Desulfobacterales bacterium GWB2_56_26]|nr:MAG: C4-dicarboxylate ABC transporter permease [Desulfobacterales bacterium GWB2_56_26]HBG21370.1 C4-dicarboxylate ABC transporter permease [Desulfobulbaceae bacterium]